MKRAISNFVCVFMLGILVSVPSMIFAHGGDAGGGGSEDGDSFNSSSSNSADDYFGSMGGGVSWTPNPNGPGILGSSVYDGRPENIEKGPYQSGTAIEDAEKYLLEGYAAGNYTADEVKEQLEWADRVGINISDRAQETLNQINTPAPVTPQEKKSAASTPQKNLATQDNDDVELLLSILVTLGQKSTQNKKDNKPTTLEDITEVALGEIAKQKIKQFKQKWGL